MTRAVRKTHLDPGAATPLRDPAMEAHKRSFLRMVSHELRTPLNAVIGFSEMLGSEIYGPLGAPQYREYADHIHQSGLKLLALVNQVLEIARLEGGAADLDLRPDRLDQAFEDVLQQLAPEAAARSVVIDFDEAAGEVVAVADARGLRTMLSNLIHNAIAWSPAGGRVTVRAQSLGGWSEIRISDQGEGMDPDDVPRLLQPFEQGESTLTRSAEGAGLGLPIVQLLASSMGGSLRIATAKGEGLTAILALPAA